MKLFFYLIFLISVTNIHSSTRICENDDYRGRKPSYVEDMKKNQHYSKSLTEGEVISCIQCTGAFLTSDETLKIISGGLNDNSITLEAIDDCNLRIWSKKGSVKPNRRSRNEKQQSVNETTPIPVHIAKRIDDVFADITTFTPTGVTVDVDVDLITTDETTVTYNKIVTEVMRDVTTPKSKNEAVSVNFNPYFVVFVIMSVMFC